MGRPQEKEAENGGKVLRQESCGNRVLQHKEGSVLCILVTTAEASTLSPEPGLTRAEGREEGSPWTPSLAAVLVAGVS